MFKDGNYIETNSKISGVDGDYDCWEFRYKEIRSLYMRNLICIPSYVTLPREYHFLSAGYFYDISAFIESLHDTKRMIYSCFFISSSLLESDPIIADLKQAHPELQWRLPQPDPDQ